MTTPATITLTDIEERAKALADARALVADRVVTLTDQIQIIRNRLLPGLKSAVAAAKEAESRLEKDLLAAPGLFAVQRTIVAHGLRVGFAKGRGKIEFADEASVIAKIEELLSKQQAALLVKIEKSLRKKGLSALKADELRRLGCTLKASGDHVYVAPVDDVVEKLVTRLLKEDAPEEDAA